MMKPYRAIWKLTDLKHVWLLSLSIILCAMVFYLDRTLDPENQLWLSIGYCGSFTLALLWSILNYISHVRVNALYRKLTDIEAYVTQLAMSDDDRAELRNYLEDYAEDLISQGTDEQTAISQAIEHFKVKELLTLSKHSAFFQLHTHQYLIGWSVLAIVGAFIVLIADGLIFNGTHIVVIAEMILFVYGTSLLILYFVYNIVNSWLSHKLDHFFRD